MSQEIWSRMDEYFNDRFAQEDDALRFALENSARKGLPPYQVSPCQGQLLHLLVKISGARRVLEIGTLGGYSTIWLARALGEEGVVVTIESNPKHAEVAAENFEAAGQAERIKLLRDPAETVLRNLIGQEAPFDLVFIDADKPSNPIYLELALRLSREGTLIVGDNVVRNGDVSDPTVSNPNVDGVRKFCDDLSAQKGLLSTAIQTVGCKGYDGFSLTFVQARPV